MNSEMPIADPPKVDLESEARRIKLVYSKRQGVFRYSPFNQGYLFRIQRLESDMLTVLKSKGLSDLHEKQILEVGCGQGKWLREFVKWGATPGNITGVDIIPESVSLAKQLCSPGVQIHCANAANLPFCDASFDLVIQFTVFSSILELAMKKMIAKEMLRLINKSGVILWYDLRINNPYNPDVRGIRKREITQLFPDCCITVKRVTLAPPLARLIAPYSWGVCYGLEKVRALNTHYLAIIEKN